MASTIPSESSLSVSDAQRILQAHLPTSASVTKVSETCRSALTTTYDVTLSDGTTITAKIAPPPRLLRYPSYVPNPLSMEECAIKTIASRSAVLAASVLGCDTSCTNFSFAYLLLDHHRGNKAVETLARLREGLSPQQSAFLDLRTGSLLKQLHDIDNDYFGPLLCKPGEEMYNWQEAFTLHIETLLQDASDIGLSSVVVPYERIRKHLSRAIGHFLFDDVEVPSLVWWDSTDDNILITPQTQGDVSGRPVQADVLAFTSFAKALWGDPLMERVFSDPTSNPQGTNQALLEGYGNPLETMPRHETKRLWYTLFLALDQIIEGSAMQSDALVGKGTSLLANVLDKLDSARCY